MPQITATKFLDVLCCPVCRKGLQWAGGSAACRQCGSVFPLVDGIIDFVDPATLDQPTQKELQGNTIVLTPYALADQVSKETRSQYESHLWNKKLRLLANDIKQTDHGTLIFLGVGAGFEIRILARFLNLQTVLCSDLSHTVLQIVPYMLDSVPVDFGLFTANLDDVPVASRDIPIVIYEALHHTADMHAAIDGLMSAGYRDILFVEPTNNPLIRLLARLGLAQRVEYSGVKPGRLELEKLDECCRRRHYRSFVKTRWEFPEDYFRRIFGPGLMVRRAVLLALDVLSLLTSPLHFGNTSIVHLQKTPPDFAPAES